MYKQIMKILKKKSLQKIYKGWEKDRGGRRCFRPGGLQKVSTEITFDLKP